MDVSLSHDVEELEVERGRQRSDGNVHFSVCKTTNQVING